MSRRFLGAWRGLPPTMYTLLAVQIVQSSGGFVQPFLALLLTSSLHFDTAQTGLFLTLNSMAMMPGVLLGGRLVDRWGRKRLLMVSRLAAAACLAACPFLDGQFALAVLLVAASVFASFGFPSIPAMVTDLTPSDRRQDAFSLLYLGHNLGFALGTTVAGFLFTHARVWLFWGETAFIVATVLLLAFLVPESRPQKQEEAAAEGAEQAHEGGLFSALVRRPVVLLFCGLMALIWMGYSQIWFSAPLWVNQVYGAEAGPPWYGVFMSFTAVVVLVITPALTRWFAGRAPALVIAGGAVLMGVGFLALWGAHWVAVLFAAGFVLTVGEVLWATGAPAYVANHSPVTHRGRFNAVLNVLQNSGSMAGPWLGGVAAASWGLAVIWPAVLAVNLAAAGGLVLLFRGERKRLQ